MKSTIKKLVETSGPSGREDQIRALLRAEIEPYHWETHTDALGNLIVRKASPTTGGLRVMLTAHMDEIGVIATHVDENGFVSFTSIGGVNPDNCQGSRVSFLNGTRGVINTEHRSKNNEKVPLEKMFIDVGADSSTSCPVQPGDMAVFEGPFHDLGDKVVSKALDDRVGVAVLLELLKQAPTSPHELVFVFTVQEEMKQSGAATAAYSVEPDLALAVDVTRTGDTPQGLHMAVALGKGPAIKVRDQGMICDPRIVKWMKETAQKAGIPYQLEVLERGWTDATVIQISRAGVPSGVISIPCRYIHSPSEMVSVEDLQHSVDLLRELISHPIELT